MVRADKFDLRTGVVALAVFAGFVAWLVWGVNQGQPQVAGASTQNQSILDDLDVQTQQLDLEINAL